MTIVSIHEAKTQLSALISALERGGEPVVIARHGRPVAEIKLIEKKKRTIPDIKLGEIEIHYDPASSLDEDWEDA